MKNDATQTTMSTIASTVRAVGNLRRCILAPLQSRPSPVALASMPASASSPLSVFHERIPWVREQIHSPGLFLWPRLPRIVISLTNPRRHWCNDLAHRGNTVRNEQSGASPSDSRGDASADRPRGSDIEYASGGRKLAKGADE